MATDIRFSQWNPSAAAAVRLIMVPSPTEAIASTFDTFRHLVYVS